MVMGMEMEMGDGDVYGVGGKVRKVEGSSGT